MADTKIEWADAVWNPVTGCTPISPGCENCYAERMSKRLAGRCGYPADEPFKVTLHPDRLEQPYGWKKPKRIFVCSMADLFHDDVPELFILEIFAMMAETPQHTYMVLTKRPERMKKILTSPTVANDVWVQTSTGLDGSKPVWPLPNVWIGVTTENQEQADKRIPVLLQTPAAVRFVSVEPLLGLVNLSKYLPPVTPEDFYIRMLPDGRMDSGYRRKIDWVIVGGETGPGARPMHPDWVRSLRDQCQAAGVPFFFKSWGEYKPLPFSCRKDGLHTLQALQGCKYDFVKVGKKSAGRLLDGQEWNEFPEVSSR